VLRRDFALRARASATASIPNLAFAKIREAASRISLQFPLTTGPSVWRRCWAPMLYLTKY
jgi:hypothetical protein